ncbi:hypothetical protein SDC9_176812 [bioreactor metagenome]|uniref:Uncharacterized protein n=1 Tax=bioreactor metagenome TaxID=1076179 RepID=A0A645GUC1_9ZZZZ
MGDLGTVHRFLHDVFRLGEGLVHVAPADAEPVADVRSGEGRDEVHVVVGFQFRMHQDRVVRGGLDGVEDGGQLPVFGGDLEHPLLRRLFGLGDHESHRFAHVADLADGHGGAVHEVEAEPVDKILSGNHLDDALYLEGFGKVNGQDLTVGHRGADRSRVEQFRPETEVISKGQGPRCLFNIVFSLGPRSDAVFRHGLFHG